MKIIKNAPENCLFVWNIVTILRTITYYFLLWPFLNPTIVHLFSLLIVCILEYFGFTKVTTHLALNRKMDRIFTLSSFNVALFVSAFLFSKN